MKLQYDLFHPSAEGPDVPVIMLHCALDSRKTWAKVAPAIAEVTRRKVYVPDARNHGDSPWSENMSWDLLVEDLEEFLDEHSIAKAALVGHGMGGKTAFMFALREPNRVERLISENAFPVSIYCKSNVLYLGEVLKKSLFEISDNADELAAKNAVMQCLQEQRRHTPPLRNLFNIGSLPIKKDDGGGFAWKTNIDVLLNFLTSEETSNLRGVYRGAALFLYGSQTHLRTTGTIRKSFYREISSGYPEEDDLEPIIFLHGMFHTGECFLNVAPVIAMETKRKAYMLDARNHGDSAWTNDMDYDLLVDDVLGFMDELKLEKACLVGHSMGGRTALYFALKFPHRVRALVVEDMTPMNVKSSGPTILRACLKTVDNVMKRAVTPEMDAKEVKHLLINGLGKLFVPIFINEEIFQDIKENFILPFVKDGGSYRMKLNLVALDAMLTSDAAEQNLPCRPMIFRGDALFLYGTQPFFKLDEDETIKKLFPKAIIQQIEGASHWIHIDSPKQYTSIISNFILNRNLQAPYL